MTVNNDAKLKRHVSDVLQNCGLEKAAVDRQVHLNLDGETDSGGNLVPQKEVDVVAKFTYRGKRILLFFECEDSVGGSGIRAHYQGYRAQVDAILANRGSVRVVQSSDRNIESKHLRDIDEIHVCFVFGPRLPQPKYMSNKAEAEKHGFIVWNFSALEYYRRISSILRGWTKYELFKDFSLALETAGTVDIPAIQLQQKGNTMFLANIHPGLLLKIGYVVRRATERTYAYQRMLSRERIAAIGEFISDPDHRNFIPNAVLAVFDSDPKIQADVRYNVQTKMLTIPVRYCSAWIIDGQHRAFGFIGTQYEDWSNDKFEPFDLPIVLFKNLEEIAQTETFININYNQKRIKTDLLCDLFALTKDLQQRLTWASLLGHELNERDRSPLKDRVRISELHGSRPISIASLVPYGLLDGLLGYRGKAGYSGLLYTYAPFNKAAPFSDSGNAAAFKAQADLLARFLNAVKKNTETDDPNTDPWSNTSDYALLSPTGINACFLLLARILEKHKRAEMDITTFLRPLRHVNFRRSIVSKMGGGWKGFRNLANTMIRRINKNRAKDRWLRQYGQKEKM